MVFLRIFYYCCFFLVLHEAVALEKTTQTEFPLPFCYFENLYFDVQTSTFFGLGKNVIPEKAIALKGNRGYQFQMADFLPNGNQKPVLLQGTTLFLFESSYTDFYLRHFFHLLEHIVGIWSFYGDEYREDVKLIVFAADGHWRGDWKGPNSINQHLMKALFPNAIVKTWSEFLEDYKRQCLMMERVFTSDREITFSSPICGKINKMLGEALPYLNVESLDRMSAHVNAYAKTARQRSSSLRVTMIRRTPPRTLSRKLERRLVNGIKALPGVDLKVVDFATISFQEQINIVGNTDVLLGVHGNGLSHILFLPPGASVIEIFPKDSLQIDYRLYANARELDYCGIIANIGILEDEKAYNTGPYGDSNTMITELDIDLVLSKIRSAQHR